jgi:hypothetical protein
MRGIHFWHRRDRTPVNIGPALEQRIATEFSEMPGLCLTLAQAARLFSAEPGSCAHAMDTLVHAGLLYNDDGLYRSSAAGAHVHEEAHASSSGRRNGSWIY